MNDVDGFVLAEMQRQKVPGVAVGVLSKGEVAAAKGYGDSNVELAVPVSAQTVFQSGSVGKQFTAVAVMLQVEDGKLALDDSITKYLPDAPASWRPVTVRHLLTHTSGIPDYTESLEEHGSQGINFRRDYTEEELTRAAFIQPLEFEPGSRWKYSNTGYLLLGVIVHKVSGRFYGDVLKERVCAPLRMKTARIISEQDIVLNRAAGYRLVNGELKNQEWVAPSLNTTADGALYLSTLDFLAWAHGLRSGAILKPESWSTIYTPVTLKSGKTYPYGFGWFIDQSNGQPWYRHSGAWQGFRTYISRYLADDLTIIVLTNLAEARPYRFVDGIAHIIDPKLAKLEPSTPIPEHDPAVTERVRKLLKSAGQGTLSPEDLPFLRASFGAAAKELQELLRPLGAPKRIDLVDRRELGDDRSFTYTVAYGSRTLRVQMALAPDDRVSDFDVEAD
ncbi:MAG: beta-lactamase family protein [Gammaproteobacteria bacterium]|nr:beta-lactamase family protein [Gammaproteobacteria bacterium]